MKESFSTPEGQTNPDQEPYYKPERIKVSAEDQEALEIRQNLDKARDSIFAAMGSLQKIPNNLRGRKNGLDEVLRNIAELLEDASRDYKTGASIRKPEPEDLKPTEIQLSGFKKGLQKWGFDLRPHDDDKRKSY